MQGARTGFTRTRIGLADEHVPAAEVRARLLSAMRIHEGRRIAGIDEDPTVEAEAGMFLAAETDVEVHEIAVIAQAWRDSHRSG